MTISTKAFQDAYAKYRSDIASAVRYTHRDLTNTGTVRQRHAHIMKARAELVSKIPSAPDPSLLTDRRPGVLAKLAPTNADQVALDGREWAKVQAMLKAGLTIQQIAHDATTVERLAAIANNVEIWAYGLNTNSPEGFAQDVREFVFDRLVAMGHEEAVGATVVDQTYRSTAAWHQFLSDTIEGKGNASIQGLYEFDRDGYEAVLAVNSQLNPAGEIDREAARLDQLVSTKPTDIVGVI
ncbi:hypothetical protein [Microbacterium rhizomatis]|uniref:Uncharacterized protein n=1 Tax=Microbacterium rhizomatis TaxID=1631477 RepID=A0A5J5J4H1_9MICO|nr:hypothetical protein [Microbacterium rhizomatis]KAA9110369.1 hypothetical protein F6B43_01355 [Microbacterium rhizomatis]